MSNSTDCTKRKKILFVDDEQKVLDGLRRMLRGMRQEWEMNFVTSGQEALDLLKSNPMDILVTDMRMPQMDGAELLNNVAKKHPHIVRIVLSGQADKEDIYRSIGPSHQYLSKPCDPEKLKLVVKRAFSLRDTLEDPKLKEIISQIKTLPSQPQLYTEILQAIENENISLKYIGEIIQKDMGMTSQILKLVNSAYFGFKNNISDSVQATSYLGLELIKSLVLSLNVFDQMKKDHLPMEQLWNHSFETAALAKDIANFMKIEEKIADAAFTAGLLHDIGLLIFATNFPEKYSQFLNEMDHKSKDNDEIEKHLFGASHDSVGAYLLGIWGLPDSIVEAVALHSNPSYSLDEDFTPLTALHIADTVTHHSTSPFMSPFKAKLDMKYLKRIIPEDKILEIKNFCMKFLEKSNEVKNER